ncbi:MAG: FAD-dependent oxidoreductase [Candidatus Dormibacteraeota bacterium]|nr:FAD-dependent oxidoreductase [Candidatus Dormibacteraeota bacterium]
MAENARFVVVGASLAGGNAVEALREAGFKGRITLVGDERELPYERPPLSKEYLMGKSEREKVFLHDDSWYRDHDIDLRLATRVTSIDRSRHLVTTEAGEEIDYDRLLLATGASPRTLPLPGADGPNVLYLRRVEDSERLRERFARGGRLIVIGAGWIGLEAAAAAREAGVEVTVLENLELPLLRVLGPECARIFADLHRRHGVDLRLGVRVEAITEEQGSSRVRLAGGEELTADTVLVGIGASPNTGLAEAAGLEVSNGVLVDQSLRTADPDILAAGDIANAHHPILGKRIRVEHWDNAIGQGEAAGRSMFREGVVYDRIPYFFTDQYDLGMEYAGYVEPGGYQEVVFRGDVDKMEFIAFWLDERQRVPAGMNVNIWDVNDTIKELVRSGRPVDRARLSDASIPLEALGSPV